MLPRSCGIPQAREIFDSGVIAQVPHSRDALTHAKDAKEYGDWPRRGHGAWCEGLNVRKKSYYELSLRRQCCGVIGILGWVEVRAGF